MIPNHYCRKTIRPRLALLAATLVSAVASTASAQFPPYDPSNPVPVETNSLIVWSLDQDAGTTATDAANPVLDGDNAGTLTGPAVSWTTGKFDGGLNFVGGTGPNQPANVGYVTTPIDGSLFSNQQVCMAAWIRPTQVNPTFGFNYIMGWNGPDSSYGFLRFNDASSIGFGLRVKTVGGTYQWAEVSYALPFDAFDGTWWHVAGTFNDGVLRLYVNGAEVASNSTGYTSAAGYQIIPPSVFHIGGVFDDPSDTRLNYAGDMDDVRLLNFVPGPPPPQPPTTEYWPDTRTVVLWHLNEGLGSNTDDSATPILDGPNDGNIESGSTVWTNSGRFGNGLASIANDTTGYLGTPIGSGLFTNQQFTMDAWIRPTAIDPDGSYIMGLDDNAGGNAGAFVRLNANANSITFAVYNVIDGHGYTQTDLEASFGPGANVLDGNWRHIAATYSNQILKVYVDGVEMGSTITPNYFTLAEPVRFNAAGSTPWNPNRIDGYRYLGDIDEIRLSNLARTDFKSVPAPQPPTTEYLPDARTVLLWHLNEGSGTITADVATPVLDGVNNGIIEDGSTVWTSAGRFGNGLVSTANFTTGYLKTSLGSGLFTTEATMDAWIRPTGFDIDGSYLMGWTCPGPISYPDPNYSPTNYAYSFLRINTGGEVGVGFQVTDGTTNHWAQLGYVNVGVELMDGTWRHIAGTFNNGVVSIYLDGALKGSYDTGYGAGWTLLQPDSFVAAGSTPWDPNRTDGYRYIGDIDEIRLSNVARTAFSTPTVSIALSGTDVVVTYAGVLQSASAVTGTYTDVALATSPYTNSASGTQNYFRSRGQ